MSEFASATYVFKAEAKRRLGLEVMFELRSSENPLLHVVELLRNEQVHLQAIQLSPGQVSLWMKLVPGAVPVNVTRWFVPRLDAATLCRRREARAYGSQLNDLIEWFDSVQRPLGVGDVLQRAATALGEESRASLESART